MLNGRRETETAQSMTDFTHSLAVVIGIDVYGRGIPRLSPRGSTMLRSVAQTLRVSHHPHGIQLFQPKS